MLDIEHAVRQRQNLQSHAIELLILQTPKECRAVAKQDKDKVRASKWPLDPAPVVEFHLSDGDASRSYLHSPFWFCAAALEHPSDVRSVADSTQSSMLGGCLVSSLQKIKMQDNKEHGLFIFGDLNAKVTGTFRLRFTLYEMRNKPGSAHQLSHCNTEQTGEERAYVANLKSVTSEVFTIHSGKTWPGQAESTALSRHLCESGVKLRIRKETSKRKALNTDWTSDKRTATAQPMLPVPGTMPPPSFPPHRASSGESIVGRLQFGNGSRLGIRDHLDREYAGYPPHQQQGSRAAMSAGSYGSAPTAAYPQPQFQYPQQPQPVHSRPNTMYSPQYYSPTESSGHLSYHPHSNRIPNITRESSSPYYHHHRTSSGQEYTGMMSNDHQSRFLDRLGVTNQDFSTQSNAGRSATSAAAPTLPYGSALQDEPDDRYSMPGAANHLGYSTLVPPQPLRQNQMAQYMGIPAYDMGREGPVADRQITTNPDPFGSFSDIRSVTQPT